MNSVPAAGGAAGNGIGMLYSGDSLETFGGDRDFSGQLQFADRLPKALIVDPQLAAELGSRNGSDGCL